MRITPWIPCCAPLKSAAVRHEKISVAPDSAFKNDWLRIRMTHHPKQSERLKKIVESFPKVTITVVGDLVADEFVFGEISRVSREAPVLILKHRERSVVPRSEEHTSELQSHSDLVCRLLLEKKKLVAKAGSYRPPSTSRQVSSQKATCPQQSGGE